MENIKIKFYCMESCSFSRIFTIEELANGLYDFHCEVNKAIKLQYTGLKDKKGVEIYEGDILLVDELGIGLVEYIESYFRIFRPYIFSVNLCNYTSPSILESKNKVEVIGNIYKNLELLEESNDKH